MAPRRPISAAIAEQSVRERILHAALDAFMERGYEGASTLEIATRAKLSKRELYALFDNKHAILNALVAMRAQRMRVALEKPAVLDRAGLAKVLTAFGAAVLREACDPAVVAFFRFAIAQAGRSDQVARVLDTFGRKANHAALADLLAEAQARGLVGAGDARAMAARFFALLWGGLLLQLLLRVTDFPDPREIERRARDATAGLLELHPPRNSRHPS